jgi:NAD(P)-dependent dehydrogenase (short-subunit alcohol dehydrogenase family)
MTAAGVACGQIGSVQVAASAGGRAIVTGGASGIGAATSRHLAERGHQVVVADVDEAAGAAVAEAIEGTFARLDVADPAGWASVVARHGPFTVAVLNAGVSTGRVMEEGELPVVGLTDAAYRRIMAINVDGVVFGTRAVLPAMVERAAGDIIVTASLAGLVPIAGDPVYGLTKHAVVGFVRSMAAALEGRGVVISALCPGFVDTKILTPAAWERVAALGVRVLDPAEVAAVVGQALDERVNGAQWVIWAGQPPHNYEWAPPIDLSALVPGPGAP